MTRGNFSRWKLKAEVTNLEELIEAERTKTQSECSTQYLSQLGLTLYATNEIRMLLNTKLNIRNTLFKIELKYMLFFTKKRFKIPSNS